MTVDLEGSEALDRMWVALRGSFSDAKERAAFALHWADKWGIHYNDDQMLGRLNWWNNHVPEDDVEHWHDNERHVERGKNHYRRMADAAMTALL